VKHLLVAVLTVGACSRSANKSSPRFPAPTSTETVEAHAPSPTRRIPEWATVTRSPWPASLDDREASLTSACGTADGALARVAARLADERARGLGAPDPDRAALLLRAQGEPHVRPRIVSASSRGAFDDAAIRARLEPMRRSETRCGVAFARPGEDRSVDGRTSRALRPGFEGNDLFVAVAVDALADLDSLPTRARTGQWLTFEASLHVPATKSKLVVLGPRGLPRTVPTTLDRASGRVRARFALDRPGAFTVQLVAELAGGPEPLLEARVFADVEPSSDADEPEPAPGEDAAAGADDAETLSNMFAALRASESMAALVRDARLDALARAHAERMRSTDRIAHDLGDGDLAVRFESAGLAAAVVGENVARARSLALVHRALHASPSHRMNLLHASYTHSGFGVVKDDSGTFYVCEVFASALR